MKLFKILSILTLALLFFSHREPKEISRCAPAPFHQQATIASVQSGNWSDPATWGGTVPVAADAPVIPSGQTITLDVDATIAGLQVDGTLQFDPNKSLTLQSSKNIIVNGKLSIKPASTAVKQLLRFTGIDETKFVGGGLDPLATDIGLWVMGSGKLDLQGASKTPWSYLQGGATAGTAAVILKSLPADWSVGDEVVIAPTASNNDPHYNDGFDLRTVTGLAGSSITLNSGIGYNHDQVNNQWSAEVINLTRNVRIDGTATGRTHVFIRSTAPQSIKNVSFRYLGPRKDQDGDGITDLVLGRYGLHFHHCDEGSRGSIVNGCVMRDMGNHSYVPHMSNGITMLNNVAYNVTESAFWWDVGDASHDIKWLHNLVALPTFIFHSASSDTPGAQTLGVNGFVLGFGDDNICDSNTVVGQTCNDAATNGAYDWEEMNNESAWEFKNNTAHNNICGLRSWQNNTRIHVIENSTLYNNGLAIFHGAYANMYRYVGGNIYRNAIEIKAASGNTNRLRFENLNINAAGLDYAVTMEEGPLNGAVPIFFRNCTITGATKAQLYDRNPGPGLKSADFIQCNVSAPDYAIDKNAVKGEVLRIQPAAGQPFKITKAGKSNITAFAPTVWGDGTGLTTEYYTGKFNSLIFKRLEPNINLPDVTDVLFHHKLTSYNYSIRWSGQLMPQFNADYTFYVDAGGGVRLWVNDKLIIDQWIEQYPTTLTSSKISLAAGQKCNIKLEYFNEDDRSDIDLYWSCSSLNKEYVPQSQLFPNPLISLPLSQPPPITRQMPITDIVIQTVIKDRIAVKSPASYQYWIYDVLGRQVQKGLILKGSSTLPAPSGRGILFMKLSNGTVKKLIKI